MSVVSLVAPLSGWCLPLAEVPDPVFAEGMAGEGGAIDPTSDAVLAPCDGELVLARDARHAFTVRADGLDVLVHIGVDTVQLKGEGFTLLVPSGTRVRAGQPVLKLDLATLARKAKSLVTPVLVASGGTLVSCVRDRHIAAGEPFCEVRLASGVGKAMAGQKHERRSMRIPFDHGLHVRPATTVVAALQPFAADVTLRWQGREANARSTVAMMALGARCDDVVEIVAAGDDAVGALEALAQVLAPVHAHATERPSPAAARGRVPAAIASRGLAVGPAAQWTSTELDVPPSSGDPERERGQLEAALDAVEGHLAAAERDADPTQAAILRGHRSLVRDPELRRAAQVAITRGSSAAAAWRDAVDASTRTLERLEDARMRERVGDLRDLEMQVLRVLSGKPPATTRVFAPGSIVIAADLLPSQALALFPQKPGAICLARGGATSHVAILAAGAGVPMLVAAGEGVLAIAEGTPLVLDAERGALEVDPPAAERAAREQAASRAAAQRRDDLAQASEPALTRDGVQIVVNANLGAVAEVAGALANGADGCGLLRTEFLFLDRRDAPPEAEQAREYQRFADALGGRTIAIRTMDVGGDKPLPYLPMPREENPALGLRGVRASLRDPALLRAQLRAILAVRPAGVCRVLLPMVTDPAELARVRAILTECALVSGQAVPLLGVMVETPSSAVMARELAAQADFLSIGSNDLAQYALAMDRGHAELSASLDALHPAVLRLMRMVADGARSHGRTASVCGALASDPQALPVLVGLGIHEVSASPAAIPALKRVARGWSIDECRALAQRALAQESAAAVRALLAPAPHPVPVAGD